jgi:secreted trypsin-like serine protease
MADPRLYEQNAFVFLEAGKPEELLSVGELKDRLTQLLTEHTDDVPADVIACETLEQQVQYLIDSYCELSIGADQYFQWFAVRLEKD